MVEVICSEGQHTKQPHKKDLEGKINDLRDCLLPFPPLPPPPAPECPVVISIPSTALDTAQRSTTIQISSSFLSSLR